MAVFNNQLTKLLKYLFNSLSWQAGTSQYKPAPACGWATPVGSKSSFSPSYFPVLSPREGFMVFPGIETKVVPVHCRHHTYFWPWPPSQSSACAKPQLMSQPPGPFPAGGAEPPLTPRGRGLCGAEGPREDRGRLSTLSNGLKVYFRIQSVEMGKHGQQTVLWQVRAYN